MAAKLTQAEFLAKAVAAHGVGCYDYSRAVYVAGKDKLAIICPAHGEFWQGAEPHVRGAGCPTCGRLIAVKNNTRIAAKFLSRAREVHGEKYDYSQAELARAKDKATIICPDHGPFKQSLAMHLRGQGCPGCGGVARMNTASFIAKSLSIHGEKYDYSQVEYTGNNKGKVTIICPDHGPFKQVPNSHLSGRGCDNCGGTVAHTVASFVAKAREVHGEKYDYSQAELARAKDKATIICPDHGPFKQAIGHHLSGRGCPACGRLQSAESRVLGLASFLSRAREIHGEKYDYSQVIYFNITSKVEIACPDHGVFKQTPGGHIGGQGQGCPACGIAANRAARLLSVDDFIAKSLSIHGEKYDYSQVEYLGNKSKVAIICPDHGPFSQTPDSHMSGQGCSACGRDRTTAAGRLHWIAGASGRVCTLYFLRLSNESEQFYKVGITRYTVGQRYRTPSSLSGYKYEVLALHQSDAARVWEWEQSILETFAHLRYKPKLSFIGETECFSSCEEILEIFPL